MVPALRTCCAHAELLTTNILEIGGRVPERPAHALEPGFVLKFKVLQHQTQAVDVQVCERHALYLPNHSEHHLAVVLQMVANGQLAR